MKISVQFFKYLKFFIFFILFFNFLINFSFCENFEELTSVRFDELSFEERFAEFQKKNILFEKTKNELNLELKTLKEETKIINIVTLVCVINFSCVLCYIIFRNIG